MKIIAVKLYVILIVLGIMACAPKTVTEIAVDGKESRPADLGQTQKSSMLGIGEVYGESIRTVQFTVAGLELSDPIVQLNEPTKLRLTFDQLSDEVSYYRYTIRHCDANWQPSQLSEIDYLSTFTEGDIQEYNLSFNSITDYTHYSLELPNQYVSWTKSGNYLLNVFDKRENKLVMRLRFCVVEPLVRIETKSNRPASVAKDRTHQEFDAFVNLKSARLENPRRTLTMTILQNGDWRTAINQLPGRFMREDNLWWDYQDKIVFPAHREWRSLDLRTFESIGGQVDELTREGEVYSAYLIPDLPRANFPFESFIDLNGKYVIEDFDNRLELQAEYAKTLFTLKMPRDESLEPLFLYGSLTNYKLAEENRGAYNSLTNGYVFQANLKQGFYNYSFVSTDESGERPDWSATDGNFFQAENEYQFLLYYRPYGERYDRLIGFETIQLNR